MRSVWVKPSCCAAASVRSQRASEPNGPRSTTGSTSVLRPVAHGHVRPAREAAVGDADELGRELDPARGRVAVEAGAVPGGDGAAVDGERQLGRDGGAGRLAADDRAQLELPGLTRAPAGDEGAVGLDRRARLLRPRRGGGVEVLDDHAAAGEALLDGAAEAHLLAEQRVAAAGEGERRGRCGHRCGRAPGGCGGLLRVGRRGCDRDERGDGQHDAGQRQSQCNFLRCLRGELTGSRRESSATAGNRPIRPRESHFDSQWVPRSPG